MFGILATSWEALMIKDPIPTAPKLSGQVSSSHDFLNSKNGEATSPGGVNSGCTIGPEVIT